MKSKGLLLAAGVAALLLGRAAVAQPDTGETFGDGPWEFMTYESGGTPVRVSIVTRGLSRPWSMAWMPDGNMLITERAGRLRVLRDGVLDPTPIAGIEDLPIDQLFDIALHPQFGDPAAPDKQDLYLFYRTKPEPQRWSELGFNRLSRRPIAL